MSAGDPLRDAIRAFLARTGMTERKLAAAAGVNEKAINQILSGRSRNPRGDTLAKIAAALGVPPAELIAMPAGVQRGAAGLKRSASLSPPPDSRIATDVEATVRIAEYDVRPQAGGGAETPLLHEDGQHPVVAHWTMPTDYLRAFVTEPSAIRIVRVAGDSMEPEYPAGERVAVDTSHRAPSPPGVYVLWDGFGLVLKRVEVLLGSDPARIRLSSVNPAYPPYERLLSEVHINGRVIGRWVWR